MNKVFRGKKYFTEALWEALLKCSGWITSIVILLIVVFLFSEGGGFFSKDKVEEGYVLSVSKSNNVKKLTALQVKDIFDGKITSWRSLGANVQEDQILVMDMDGIASYASDSELEDESNIPKVINKVMNQHPNIITFVPKEYTQEGFSQRTIEMGKENVKDFLVGRQWFPTAEPVALFGVLPIVLGTLWVSLGAILLALPFGLAVAIYCAELASDRMHKIIKPVIELLAGIPSVVYGSLDL